MLFTICTDYTGYCPDTCSGLYNPVCGRDGKIYLNRCQLLLKICETNNDWLYSVSSNDCFDGMFNKCLYWYNMSLKMDLNDETFTLNALRTDYCRFVWTHSFAIFILNLNMVIKIGISKTCEKKLDKFDLLLYWTSKWRFLKEMVVLLNICHLFKKACTITGCTRSPLDTFWCYANTHLLLNITCHKMDQNNKILIMVYTLRAV